MDPRSILNTLKEASPFDLFLISFIALPFVFESWLRILEKLDTGLNAKYWSLGIVLLAYVAGIVSVLTGSNRQRRRETARDEILNYLARNGFKMVTLETIRSNINPAYDDKFLKSLPLHFPNELRRATLKDNRAGLARLGEETDEYAA